MIAFVTDTATYISQDLEHRLNQGEYDSEKNLFTVPLNVSFPDKVNLGYQRKIEKNTSLTDLEILKKLDISVFLSIIKQSKLTSSQPSIAQVAQVYQCCFDLGYDTIVGVFISETLSATYNSAIQATEHAPGKYWIPSLRTFSVLNTFLLEEAMQFDEMEDIQRVVSQANEYVTGFLTVSDLMYLERSGRLSGVKRFVATALNITPILTEKKKGELVIKGGGRNLNNALKRMGILIKREAPDGRYYVIHAGMHDEAGTLADNFEVEPIELLVTPVIANAGPFVAVAGLRGDYDKLKYTSLSPDLITTYFS